MNGTGRSASCTRASGCSSIAGATPTSRPSPYRLLRGHHWKEQRGLRHLGRQPSWFVAPFPGAHDRQPRGCGRLLRAGAFDVFVEKPMNDVIEVDECLRAED